MMKCYHDTEWGVPVHDDRKLFEFLILEGAQAGLSWKSILSRRENYKKAFDNFEPQIVANYNESKLKELKEDRGIIRNKLKIKSAVTNALAVLDIQEEFGSLDTYLWQFVGRVTIQNHWKNVNELPATTIESENMSRDLKKRGFKFVGPTICYSFMQAVGMVNDHTVDCFRYKDL
ncbi:MAG: DNA-3-methyladenine glycosylase I [Methanobacterium sp. ERen5]|nr:MAG: DNA-3-methyladenine glycosylase I [Methanobacterium sp. ERen5]